MAKKGMPTRKGGAMFPRVDLKQAAEYAKKLVSKTHTGAQPPKTLYPGVFGAKGNRADVRASALKQYGLLAGSNKDGFRATELAKKVVHATDADRAQHLATACLKPAVFKRLYDTFRGDRVSVAKIRQQAANLNVHPENTETCATLFVDSVVHAQLGRLEDEDLVLAALQNADVQIDGNSTHDSDVEPSEENGEDTEMDEGQIRLPPSPPANTVSRHRGSAVVNVTITVDSSLDTEKLEKQLELLRRFGAL